MDSAFTLNDYVLFIWMCHIGSGTQTRWLTSTYCVTIFKLTIWKKCKCKAFLYGQINIAPRPGTLWYIFDAYTHDGECSVRWAWGSGLIRFGHPFALTHSSISNKHAFSWCDSGSPGPGVWQDVVSVENSSYRTHLTTIARHTSHHWKWLALTQQKLIFMSFLVRLLAWVPLPFLPRTNERIYCKLYTM